MTTWFPLYHRSAFVIGLTAFAAVHALAADRLVSTGSAFYIARHRVVTCAHCVEGTAKIRLLLADKSETEARVVFADTESDLAVLETDAPAPATLALGDSDALELFDAVYVFGFPGATYLGAEISGTEGKLNSRRKMSNAAELLQVDAAINPGNSGGPALDAKGRVIGVARSKINLKGVERSNFLVPSNVLKNRLRRAGVTYDAGDAETVVDWKQRAIRATVLLARFEDTSAPARPDFSRGVNPPAPVVTQPKATPALPPEKPRDPENELIKEVEATEAWMAGKFADAAELAQAKARLNAILETADLSMEAKCTRLHEWRIADEVAAARRAEEAQRLESQRQELERLAEKARREQVALEVATRDMTARLKKAFAGETAQKLALAKLDGILNSGRTTKAKLEAISVWRRELVAGTQYEIKSLALRLQWIEPGSFIMGSPISEAAEVKADLDNRLNERTKGELRYSESSVRVTLTKGYWMGATEVTQAQWRAVMGSAPSYFKGDDLPVEQVSWDDAMAFCRKLTDRERAAGRLPAGYAYTLPTEAQWEYACRAGTTGPYSGDFDAMAWYGENASWTTHPVGTTQPNAWGLYDMHGNVLEWTRDRWSNTRIGSADPIGPVSGSERVVRGGSWGYDAGYCRSAFRYCITQDNRYIDGGFRLALSSVSQDE